MAGGGRIFQFAVFEASEAVGELRKHGVKIKLHAQPFQVLLMLLENAGQIVTRKEIQQKLWGDDTFVDFDHGLNAAVNKIREALDDSASAPRFVETVPGKGYRFIGTVALKDPAPSQALVEKSFVPIARPVSRTLLLLIQTMYLAFYFGALGNLAEIREIFDEVDWAPPHVLMAVMVVTATILIPVRLFISTGVVFDFSSLRRQFQQIFPFLFVLDLLWAVAPFLLIHHINTGIALGFCAALVYTPFAQRSLLLMFSEEPSA